MRLRPCGSGHAAPAMRLRPCASPASDAAAFRHTERRRQQGGWESRGQQIAWEISPPPASSRSAQQPAPPSIRPGMRACVRACSQAAPSRMRADGRAVVPCLCIFVGRVRGPGPPPPVDGFEGGITQISNHKCLRRHWIRAGPPAPDPSFWSTACGWKWGRSTFAVPADPAHRPCGRCVGKSGGALH